jgi:hypothetical protein
VHGLDVGLVVGSGSARVHVKVIVYVVCWMRPSSRHATTVNVIVRDPDSVVRVGSNDTASDSVEPPARTSLRANRSRSASQMPALRQELSRAPDSEKVRRALSFVRLVSRTTSVKRVDWSDGRVANAKESVPSAWTCAITGAGVVDPGWARVVDSPAALEKSAGCVADGLGEGVQLGDGDAVHVGDVVGEQVGDADGVQDGDVVGVQLGEAVGVHVGEPVGVGLGVDVHDGDGVGDGALPRTTTVIATARLSVPPARLTSRVPW